jgi:large subunit ribosomal protein L9
MKVILQKDISNLGEAGDIKEVADGYARNFLLPKKMVIAANESSQKAIAHQKKLIKIKKEKRQKDGQKLIDALANAEVRIKALAGEEDKLFGSVTTADLSKKFTEMGYTIDRKKIHIDEPIKKIGEYSVNIKLGEGLTAAVKVIVEKE